MEWIIQILIIGDNILPEYIFEHPKTKKVKSVILSMKEDHIYEENGVKWNRVFQLPQAAVDVKLNPFSAKDFVRKTGVSKGVLGDLYKRAEDASAERQHKEGTDKIKLDFKKTYEKQRKNKKLPVKNGNQIYHDRLT